MSRVYRDVGQSTGLVLCVCLWLLVSVISTEVTYTVGGLIFAWIVEDWVWDYAITVTLLHIGLTVAGEITCNMSNTAAVHR